MADYFEPSSSSTIVFGVEGGDYIEFSLRAAVFEEAEDYWDKYATSTLVTAHAEPFHGTVETTMWPFELARLQEMLVGLSMRSGQRVEQEFSSFEKNVAIRFTLVPWGQLTLRVDVHAGPLLDTSLEYGIEVDESYLAGWIENVGAVLERFPRQSEP